MDYLTELRHFHQHAIQPYLGLPKGCSPRTLAQFEQSLTYELPLAYRQYLAWMGEDYAGILQGTNCFITDVHANTAALPNLLAENQIAFALPASMLVFYMHQGYVAAWFTLPKESDNPLIWFFSEGQDMMQPITAGTFTDFLLTDMQGLAAIRAETRRTIESK
jgi:hypothetical protein